MKRITLLLLALLASVAGLSAQIERNTTIKISIVGVPPSEQARINQNYPVDSQGNVRMWEIGSIRAAGLQPTTLAKRIEAAYRSAQIYTSPTILIETGSAKESLNEQVTVTGKVNRPGPIPWVKDMTLAQAIAAAGGVNTFGTSKRVYVYREGKKYELSPRTNDRHKLERIYAGDTVEVDQVKAWESGGE
ncbi:MAG: SLBB domain-containing protein [Verrucomicrobiota bacterium JB023]|nr:SLBB domain-containing protein [Verrucomicrobiota bacterium JB023]